MAHVITIFGSAAVPGVDPSTPRDIDVAYAGDWGTRDVARVRAWAAGVGLPSDLPLDVHRVDVYADNTVCLPTPEGVEGHAVVLRGENLSVRWIPHCALPARIRAAHTPPQLRAALDRELPWPAWRLCIFTRSARAEWDDYVQGLTALRNAIAKCAVWPDDGLHGVYDDAFASWAEIFGEAPT